MHSEPLNTDVPFVKRSTIFFAVGISPNKIGGIERFAVELARQLDLRNWNLTLCFEDTPPPLVEAFLLAPGNVSLAVMKDQFGLGAANAIEFLRLFWRFRPKVVLYSLGGVVRWWPLLGRLAGARRVVYYDQTSRTARTLAYRASKRVQLFMRALSQSVCATQFIKNCSDREGIVPPQKSRVIYSAIDNHRDLGSGRAFRQRHQIPDDRIVILQISWLVPEKGIGLALLAAKRALEVRKDLQFVFCGDGKNRDEYERSAQEMGIAKNVTWTGQVQDLAESGVFRAADIQIQCSQWHEAFCLAVAEGMSAGLPVVASRMGGLPELVEDGLDGFLFDPQSDVELANAIVKLAADKELRRRMGSEGRKRAIAKHDLTQNVKLWVETLLPSQPNVALVNLQLR